MNKQQGFSLIEVLLAVVVLSIGLLAGSRMQMLGMNYTQSGMIRSHATLAANDILDRIRVNKDEAISQGAYDGVNTSAAAPSDPGCSTSIGGCDAGELANLDIRQWYKHFGQDGIAGSFTPLNGATGTISRSDTNLFTINISWAELIGGNSENRQISVSARL